MTDDVPTPFKTEGSAEDFAVLYGAELTVEADGGGTSEDAFLKTRADEQRVKIHIGYTLSGITDVTVSPLSDLANTTEYEAAAEQPKHGTRWVAEGEPDVEIVPESQVHNRVVTDGGVPVSEDLPRLEVADDEISTGDIVVDLSSGKGLQVVGKSSMTVGEHPQTRSDATAEMFGADPGEPVFDCVFLPDGEKLSPPTKSYAYPASRLLRYPVENATDHAGGVQTWLRVAFLNEIADAIADEAFGFQFEAELRELLGDVYSDDVAHLFEEILESKRSEVSA